MEDKYSVTTDGNSGLAMYVPIAKRDEEQRMVYGYASTPDEDSQGDRIESAAMAAALPDYMKFGNIREMHQPSAVGKAHDISVDHTGGTYLAAKVVDDVAWKKVKEGVYNGFSIGGVVKERDGNVIKGIKLIEISLVDRPANPNTTFDLYKCEDATVTEAKTDTETTDTQEAITEEPAATDKVETVARRVGDETEYLRRASALGLEQDSEACLRKRYGYTTVNERGT